MKDHYLFRPFIEKEAVNILDLEIQKKAIDTKLVIPSILDHQHQYKVAFFDRLLTLLISGEFEDRQIQGDTLTTSSLI